MKYMHFFILVNITCKYNIILSIFLIIHKLKVYNIHSG